jgi:hypothetical protein
VKVAPVTRTNTTRYYDICKRRMANAVVAPNSATGALEQTGRDFRGRAPDRLW